MDGLKHLLKASSQKVVEELFLLAFNNRDSKLTIDELKQAAEALQLSAEEAEELLASLHIVVSESIYENMSPEQVVEILPDDLMQKMKILVAKIITHHLPAWRQQTLAGQISLPRLSAIDWRLDIKNSSDQYQRISGPAVVVQLKINGVADDTKTAAEPETVVFELNRDTLETMLEGLSQIRDQLNTIQE